MPSLLLLFDGGHSPALLTKTGWLGRAPALGVPGCSEEWGCLSKTLHSNTCPCSPFPSELWTFKACKAPVAFTYLWAPWTALFTYATWFLESGEFPQRIPRGSPLHPLLMLSPPCGVFFYHKSPVKTAPSRPNSDAAFSLSCLVG